MFAFFFFFLLQTNCRLRCASWHRAHSFSFQSGDQAGINLHRRTLFPLICIKLQYMTKSNNDTIGAEPQAWVPAFHHWPRSRCLHLPENTQRYFGQIHLNTEGEKKKKKRKKTPLMSRQWV